MFGVASGTLTLEAHCPRPPDVTLLIATRVAVYGDAAHFREKHEVQQVYLAMRRSTRSYVLVFTPVDVFMHSTCSSGSCL